MSDDTDRRIPPAHDERQAAPDDRPASDAERDDRFPAPAHPTDAEIAQQQQDRELESGEENPG